VIVDAMQLPANKTCPIAGALGVLGQKWNLLLLREAFLGSTRFVDFQRIGIPSATLGARLESLVTAGLLERREYQEAGERARDEYRLTLAGRATIPILAALAEWGGTHLHASGGPGVVLTGAEGQAVHLQFVDDRGAEVSGGDVRVARGRKAGVSVAG
jgi:DNA-binding HxlR family transcriptional regulator